MKKVAIKGDGTTKRMGQIITYFIGSNRLGACMNYSSYVYIDEDVIRSTEDMPIGYTLIDLPEMHGTTVYDNLDLIIERDILRAENEILKLENRKAKHIINILKGIDFNI